MGKIWNIIGCLCDVFFRLVHYKIINKLLLMYLTIAKCIIWIVIGLLLLLVPNHPFLSCWIKTMWLNMFTNKIVRICGPINRMIMQASRSSPWIFKGGLWWRSWWVWNIVRRGVRELKLYWSSSICTCYFISTLIKGIRFW